MKIFVITILLLLFIISSNSYASENIIPITYSETMDKIIFDGKWSFFSEWKHSTLTSLENDSVIIRTAHQDNQIYVLIDSVVDSTYDRGSDSAMICFDTLNNKSIRPDSDDLCFVSIMGKNHGYSLQGGTNFAALGHLQKTQLPIEFIAIGGTSDENDRYSKTPHMSYEFRIPTDVVGRSNEYGFYVQVFDSNQNSYHTWPEHIKNEKIFTPSPETWGRLVSIDNSLPEFPTPIIMIMILLSTVALFSRKNFSPLVNKIIKN